MKCPTVPIKSRQMLPRYSDEELTLLAQRVGLTLEQLKALHQAGNATYQAIGGDIGGGNRETIVEVVMDCNYMENFGNAYLTPELVEWLHTKATKYKLNHVYAAMAAGFPYSEYE